jgi:hypothetical protein
MNVAAQCSSGIVGPIRHRATNAPCIDPCTPDAHLNKGVALTRHGGRQPPIPRSYGLKILSRAKTVAS